MLNKLKELIFGYDLSGLSIPMLHCDEVIARRGYRRAKEVMDFFYNMRVNSVHMSHNPVFKIQ